MKKIILFLFATAIMLNACKKDKEELPATTGIPKIKTYSESPGELATMEYDQQGRKVKETFTYNGTINSIGQITYGTNTVNEKFYGSGNGTILTLEKNHDLNSAGFAAHTTQSNGADIIREFDTFGHCTKMFLTYAGLGQTYESRYYYNNNGRLDSLVSKSANSGTLLGHYKYIYEYNISKPNTITEENWGIFYLGKGSALPPAKLTYYDLLSGTQGETRYEYEFDAKNNITKVTSITSTGAYSEVYTYY